MVRRWLTLIFISHLSLCQEVGAWIGLQKAEGTWSWSDGSNLSYLRWLPGQPDNYGNNENCGHLLRRNAAEDKTKTWNDLICTTVLPYICKMKPNTIMIDVWNTFHSWMVGPWGRGGVWGECTLVAFYNRDCPLRCSYTCFICFSYFVSVLYMLCIPTYENLY